MAWFKRHPGQPAGLLFRSDNKPGANRARVASLTLRAIDRSWKMWCSTAPARSLASTVPTGELARS